MGCKNSFFDDVDIVAAAFGAGATRKAHLHHTYPYAHMPFSQKKLSSSSAATAATVSGAATAASASNNLSFYPSFTLSKCVYG